MKYTKTQIILLIANLISVFGFGTYYLQLANYEFLAYAGTIVIVIGVLYATLNITKFPTYIIAGVSI